jgi:peptidyl-prolyl cis-trans isomerase D
MFEFVRSHTRLMLGLIVLLIVPSFVFFGIQGYTRMTSGEQATVAKVDGHAITQAEWDLAHRRTVDRMRQQVPGIDVRLLDTPQVRRETLDGVVRERVLLAAAQDQHLFPTDDRLHRLFTTDAQFAGLRNPDGSVNRDLLAAQGMTSEMFAQQLTTQLGMQQVMGGINASVVASPAVADAALDALLQRREIQLQRFDTAAYLDQVKPTDAEIEAHYRAHESEFRAPERARIEYVVLDADALGKDVTVPEADLQRYYEENASRYTKAEERRARHILIEVDASASKDVRAKAEARAEELLKQARANPAGFAELARKYSQDQGSAAQGGDLDWFGRGAMVKPFEDAVFAMKPGEISNVVESDFGYHIIQLTEVRGGTREPFASVRDKIEAEVRKSLAQRRYAEAAEQFSNMVYEQPDSLQPVIDKFKLEKKVATVGRQPAPGASGPLASPKLLEAVFGDDALRNKRNTEAVEVGANQLVSARVVQHEPEHTLPLAEVRDRVRQAVVAVQASERAHRDGQARLASVKADATAALPQTLTVSRAQAQEVPLDVLNAALGADPQSLPATLGVDLGSAGYAVMRVLKVLPRDPAAGGGEAPLRAQYAQAWANAEVLATYEALKKRYKVQVKVPDPGASAAAR